MGFKADTSFLRFLSMGAAGARQTMAQMRGAGFEPIELERYCTSNKIWSTKVKRLRLPDILCVRTGLRVEVRAKSDLKIRMSDATKNPDRRWHTGLRDIDLSAFIACFDENGTSVPAEEAVYFTVGDLKLTEDQSELGPAKSASEGAERDRTWASIVPVRNGVVQSVDATTLRVLMNADNQAPQRNQTYQLRGKTPYVAPGDNFVGKASVLAGVPAKRVQLEAYRNQHYDPMADLAADNPVDRYAAVKSLPFRLDKRAVAATAIESRLNVETESRVQLEAAGAGALLGSAQAQDFLEAFVWKHDAADLRMEAVLILTESKSAAAGPILLRIANDPQFADDEIRQAAIWGLGKIGLARYADLIPFLGDRESDVVLHAIAGFGADATEAVIDELIHVLLNPNARSAAAASEALRRIGSDLAVRRVVEATRAAQTPSEWLFVTLGRFPEAKVRPALAGDPLFSRVSPILLLSGQSNWLAQDAVDIDLKFLFKQNL
jgi:hypothetical protein